MKRSERQYEASELQTIKRYVEGKMSSDEQGKFEMAMQEDPFLKDAVEGYVQDPDWSGYEQLAEAIEEFVEDRTPYWNLKRVIRAAAVVIFLVTLGSASYTMFTTNVLEQVAEERTTQPALAVKTVPEFELEQAVVITEMELEEAMPIAEEEQITYVKTVENQPITLVESEVKEQLEFASVETLPTLAPTLSEYPETPKKVALSNSRLIYLKDLKVIDYTQLYAQDIIKPVLMVDGHMGGTSAKYEGYEMKLDQHDPDMVLVQIPYKDFLEGALGKFELDNFKGAVKDFNLILKQYPDDLNARFYVGLCYYNLNKTDLAIKSFDIVMQSSLNTFEQEAEWYRALTVSKGDLKLGKKAFRRIFNKDGIYAEKAKKRLDKFAS